MCPERPTRDRKLCADDTAHLIGCKNEKRENVIVKRVCDTRLLSYFCLVAIVTMMR